MTMQLHELVSPERIDCALAATSKKRLLENLSTLMRSGNPGLDDHAAFQCLIERERLGSTGVGNGIAIPHGRMRGLDKAVGAFAILESDMDYDAIDQKPVKLVFALLVPENATDEHLQLLSQIARMMADDEYRNRLLAARTSDQVYDVLCDADLEYQKAS
jgi:PTS system nitrogen regulatory IIA component